MDARFMSNVSRKPTILHPGLPLPAYVTVLLTSTCLLVIVILLYVAVTYYRNRSNRWSLESSSTEPCSPVLPFDAAISQSTPDFLENHGINDDPQRCDYGSRSKTVVKQHTLPVMMQRHLSFHRQLSHSIDTDDVGSVLKGCSVPAQPTVTRNGTSGQKHPTGSATSQFCSSTGSKIGRLCLTLRYDQELSSLVVRLLRAENLPPKDFSGTSDPYVRLYLLPDRKARHQSKLHRKTLNPVFEESFRFPVPFGSLSDHVLQMSIYDFDRFSRHDLIGVAVIKNILGGSTDPFSEQLYELSLIDVAESANLGELLISLVYLPMAGRLTLNVMKAKNLQPSTLTGTVSTNVKVTLMCHGKHIKKKKTSGKLATPNPTYNEAMVFDVPYDTIDEVLLIVRVISQDEFDNSEVIGSCAVGQQILGVGHDHWTEVLENPRKPVAQWHRLMERTPSIASLQSSSSSSHPQ